MMGAMMTPKPPGGCVGGDCSGVGQAPIYPSLMTLPTLTADKRAELDALASQQTTEGMARLSKGIEALDVATRSEDEVAKQQAVGMMHEALNELEAGIAARRVLAEGKAPRNLALDWFKRELSLASPVVYDEPRGVLGLPVMHLFTMVLLVAFALAMLAMYFFKMRRAASLFGRVEPDGKSAPPGSAAPIGGASAPSSPPGGKSPSAGASPSAPGPPKEDPRGPSGGKAPAPPAVIQSTAQIAPAPAQDSSSAPPSKASPSSDEAKS